MKRHGPKCLRVGWITTTAFGARARLIGVRNVIPEVREDLRTTLDIDDRILEIARASSRAQGRSLGSIVSELARRGLAERHWTSAQMGLPTFDVRPDSRPITLEMIREAMAEA